MKPRMVVVAVAVALASAGCGTGAGSEDASEIDVVASFYPLEYVASEVGGDLIDVVNLTPPGAEPHDLELTPGQARALAGAELVLYLGDGFQPSVEEVVADLDGEVVDALAGQPELFAASGHEVEEEHADEHEDEAESADEHEDEGQFDPHVWLDPKRLARIANLVADRLAEVDPANEGTYRANAADLESRLDRLDDEFRDGLARCERHEIVTSHQAFGYLAAAYGLEEVGISGIDPEAEPSPQRLAQVTEFVRQNDVTTIYFEELVPRDIAETLAEEADVATASLSPLEGAPEGGDYFTAMRANLDALREGLGCR